MTKSDKVGVVLRKIDYLWSKKGGTFCQAIKEVLKDKIKIEDVSDDEVIQIMKDIDPNEKD